MKKILLLLVLFLSFFGAKSQCTIEVSISSPGWGDNTTWQLLDVSGTAIITGGTYGNNYSDVQSVTSTNPPYTLVVTVNTNTFCDNFPDYSVTVGGVQDVSGQMAIGGGCGGSDSYVINTPCPSCSPPSNAPVSGLSATAATLNWTSTETAFDVEWGLAGFVPTGLPSAGYNDVASGVGISGLTSGTTYDYYLRTDCAAGGGSSQSPWVGPFSFTTSPDYCAGDLFEDTGGATGAYSAGENTTYVICPDNPGDIVTVTFTSFQTENNWDGFMIYDGPSNASPLISSGGTGFFGLPDGAWNGDAGTADPFAPSAPFLSTDASGCLTFEFTSDGSGQEAGWSATVICAPPPACFDPSALGATGITGSSADLFWTENGSASEWDIELGIAGFVPTGSPTVGLDDVTNDTIVVTSLASQTQYEYYVRADCAAGGGTGQSNWVGPFSFTTGIANLVCGPGNGNPSFVYIQDFDTDIVTGPGGTSANIGPWTQVRSTDPDWTWDSGGGTPSTPTGPSDGYNGGSYVYLETSGSAQDPDTLTSNAIDLSAVNSPARLRFFYHMFGADIGTMTVETSNDGGLTWNPGISFVGQQQSSSTDAWKEAAFDISYAVGSSNFLMRWIGTKNNGAGPSFFYGDMAIDLVRIEACVSCVAPSSPSATVISSDSAQIDFTAFASSDSTFIEYGVAGFTPGTGIVLSTTTNSAIISGLSGATDYDVYLYSDCSGSTGDSSTLAGPISFTTPCAPYTPVYFEDFSALAGTTSLPLCWEEYNQVTPATFVGATPSTSGIWTPDGFGNDATSPYSVTATTGAARVNVYNLGDQDWLVSPEIDLSTGGPYQLDYNWTITAFSGTGFQQISDDDYIAVLITTDGGATWTELGRYDSSTVITPTPLGETAIFDLTAYAGNVIRIGFFADEGAVDDVSDVNFYMDNFRVRPIPTCPEPIGLTVTNVSFDAVGLSWTETGSATVWEVEYGAPGFTPGTGTVVAVSGSSSTIVTALMEQTTYDFVVRAICSPGDSSEYSLAASATTLCAPVSTPTPGPETFELVSPASFGDLGNCWNTSPTSGYRWESEDATGANENSTGTGPFTDHTLAPAAGGIYLYTEATNGSAGDSAFLNGPLVDLSGLAFPNVSFWYHMYGAAMGDLSLQINDGTGWNTITTISGQQQTAGGDEWIKFSANILNYSGIVQFRFVGVRGTSFTSDMAIDDVSIQEAPTNELAVSSIDAPMSGCGMESTPITITVDNNGANTLLYVPVVVQLTGDFAGVYTLVVDTLPALSTVQLTLDSINTLAGGLTDITAFTNLANDSDPSNDTSTVSLTFGAVPATPVIADVVACEGESVDLGFASAGTLSWFESDTASIPFFQGDTLTMLAADTTFYVSQQASIVGCPSDLAMVQLSTVPTYLDTVVMTACDSMVIGGVAQTTSGFYADSLTSVAGCDSIVVFDLTVNNSYAEARSATICDNASFTLPDGVVVNTAGTYTSVLTAANGCDSVITYDISVVSSFTITQALEACEGDTVLVGTSEYTATGTYVDSLISVGGCDSLVTTSLLVYPAVNVSIGGVTVVCESAPAVELTLTPTGGVLSGPGVVDSTSFNPADAGVGVSTLTYTFADGNGCDATASLDVEVVVCTGIEDIEGIETLSIYPNPYISTINLLFDDAVAGELNITLFDVTGRILKVESVITAIGANTIRLDVSPEVAAGVHILQIERDGAVYSTTIIKK